MKLTKTINPIFNTFSFLCLFLLTGLICKSQNADSFRGRIINLNNAFLSDVHVLNVSQNIGVISDQVGVFYIKANPGDSILFSRIDYLDTILILTNDLNLESNQDILLTKRNTVLNGLDLFPKRPFLDTANREGGEVDMNLPFKISGFGNVERDYSKFVFSGFGVAVRIGVKTKQLRGKEELAEYKKQDEYLMPFLESFDTTFYTTKLKIPQNDIINFVEFFTRNPEVRKRIETNNSYYFISELQDSAKVFLKKSL